MNSKIPIWLILCYMAVSVAVGFFGVPFLGTFSPGLRWVILVFLFLGFFVLVGWKLHKRFDGIFIDSRFKMSLSRFQIILWTLMTFSALFTIALERNRLMAENPQNPPEKKLSAGFQPLNIDFPNELLLAMGISITSLAGASIIKNVKKEQETGKSLELLVDEEKRAADKRQEAQSKISAAQDLVNKLAVDEGAVKTTYSLKQNQWTQQKTQLETDLATGRAKVEQAQTNLTANPTDQALIAALETAKKELQDKDEELRKAREAWNIEEKKFIGSLDFIKSENDRLAKEIKYAEIDLKRAEEEANRIAQARANKEGLIHKNSGPEQADWIDIFRGDEVGNYQVIDISKVQMFFLTIVIVCTYGIAIWMNLTPEILKQATFSFPPFSEKMNALLGISHAGYLVVKGSGR